MCNWLAGENAPFPDVANQTLSVLTKAACGTGDPIISFFYRPDVRAISLPKIKTFGFQATSCHMDPFFLSSFLLSFRLLIATYRAPACVSSRSSRTGPRNMLKDCLVAMLGMSSYKTKPIPQTMPLPFSIPITGATGKSRKWVRCIACSSHFRS